MTEQEWLNRFGEKLVDIMDDECLTQKDFAKETGLSVGIISEYVNKRKMPTIKTILRLSYTFDIDVAELIDFGDEIH